jgi:hypothetical protein
MMAGAIYVDEVSSNVRHLPARSGSTSLTYLLVPPIQEASVDISDDEATSGPPAVEPMLPVTRAAAVGSLSLGTGDVGESRRHAPAAPAALPVPTTTERRRCSITATIMIGPTSI